MDVAKGRKYQPLDAIMKSTGYGLVIASLVFLLGGCEEPSEEMDPRRLSGYVTLENQSDQSNALIYIDELNRGVITNSSGSFTISFGDADTVYTGVYTVYYFLEDYDLESVQIELDRGEVVYDSYDVGRSGTLPTIQMKQVIKVEGWTDKETYQVDDSIYVDVKMTNVSNNTIRISFGDEFSYLLPRLALYSTPDEISYPLDLDLTTEIEELSPGDHVQRRMITTIPEGTQEWGQYNHIQTGDYMVGFNPKLHRYWDEHNVAILHIQQYSRFHWRELYDGPTPYGPYLPNKYEFPVINVVNDEPAEDFWLKTNAPDEVWFTDLVIDGEGYVIASTSDGLIYISNDGGTSWSVKDLSTDRVSALVINQSGEILAATFDGIFESADHGQTWSQSYFDTCMVFGLAYQKNGYLYAGTECGNYRSIDNGQNWAEMNVFDHEGLSTFTWMDFFGVASDNHVYAGHIDGLWGAAFLFRSDDYGSNWYGVSYPRGLCGRAFIINSQGHAFIGSTQGDECGPAGLWRSTDNGQSWDKISDNPHSFHEGFVDPNGNLYYTGYGGIFYSTDDGSSWGRFNDIGLGTNWILGLAMSPDGHLYALSDWGGIYRTAEPTNGIMESGLWGS